MSALDALAFLLFLPPSLLFAPFLLLSPSPFPSWFYVPLSFVPGFALSRLSFSHSVALHPAFSHKRESRMTEDSVESLFTSANRKLETSDRAATAAATIKRYVPPSEPARKICRSIVDPRGTVMRSDPICTSQTSWFRNFLPARAWYFNPFLNLLI